VIEEINLDRINSNKKIITILTSVGIKTNGAKKWLVDNTDDIIGVLQQNNEPYIFTIKEYELLRTELIKKQK